MRIAVVGLGRLGMPLAVAADLAAHQVSGYDIRPDIMRKDGWGHKEWGDGDPEGFPGVLRKSAIAFAPSISELLSDEPDVVFVCVQTPHQPAYDGTVPLPGDRADFDYTYLKQACEDVAYHLRLPTPVVVVSTVLPGTCQREILPVMGNNQLNARLVYAPQFIAMGTALKDFLDPEFWLLGSSGENDGASLVRAFFLSVAPQSRIVQTTVENAEAIKVFYNTFIGMKVAFANAVGEAAHHLGCVDADVVMRTLGQASRRLISPAYLDPGMGDGGACHPRDNIALSWMAKEIGQSYDIFSAIMEAREAHSRWLVDLAMTRASIDGLPICVLGLSYKAGSDLHDGSPALLALHQLGRLGAECYAFDPVSGLTRDCGRPVAGEPCVFLLGCAHREVLRWPFPSGSVVIDPFRRAVVNPDVKLLSVGRRK